MKKTIMLLLALALVIAMSACGGGGGAGNADGAPGEISSPPPPGTEAEGTTEEETVYPETLDTELDPSERGATSANLSNGGRWAKAGDTIIFHLNYLRPDGALNWVTEDSKAIHNINVSGDTVYYSFNNEEDDVMCQIMRMNADCSGQEVLHTADYQIEALVLAGEWLYYTMFDIPDYKTYLCRIKTDGTGNEILIDPSLEGKGAAVGDDKICVGKTAIYYRGWEGVLWKADLDGSNPRKFGGGISPYGNATLHGEWIYYTGERPDGGDGASLYRIRTDGTNEIMVMENAPDVFDFYEDRMYCISWSEDWESSWFYTISDDGTGEPDYIFEEPNEDSNPNKIAVMGDVLYLDSGSRGEFVLAPDGRILMQKLFFFGDFEVISQL
jgi:hypothetical protein